MSASAAIDGGVGGVGDFVSGGEAVEAAGTVAEDNATAGTDAEGTEAPDRVGTTADDRAVDGACPVGAELDDGIAMAAVEAVSEAGASLVGGKSVLVGKLVLGVAAWLTDPEPGVETRAVGTARTAGSPATARKFCAARGATAKSNAVVPKESVVIRRILSLRNPDLGAVRGPYINNDASTGTPAYAPPNRLPK